MVYKQILNEEARMGRVLPRSDYRVKMVEKVLVRLIEAGNLGTGQSDRKEGVGWTVHVIDDPGKCICQIWFTMADGVGCRPSQRIRSSRW